LTIANSSFFPGFWSPLVTRHQVTSGEAHVSQLAVVASFAELEKTKGRPTETRRMERWRDVDPTESHGNHGFFMFFPCLSNGKSWKSWVFHGFSNGKSVGHMENQ
jgi:hypothetical protein